jgi:DNA-binding response OmpR family regulator
MEKTTHCQVLVIDDMQEMQEMMSLLLSHERDDCVMYARGGLEGLEIAEHNPPQLIILDLMMPDLSGYQVFQRLQAMPRLRNVPVLLLTVLPPEMVYPKAQQLGIAGYVCKPFEFSDLLLARDTVLRGETYYPRERRRSTGPLDRTAHSG